MNIRLKQIRLRAAAKALNASFAQFRPRGTFGYARLHPAGLVYRSQPLPLSVHSLSTGVGLTSLALRRRLKLDLAFPRF